MLDDKRIAEIRQGAADAALGFNTQDLMRRYGKDVKQLLDEREELLKRVAALESELNDRPSTEAGKA